MTKIRAILFDMIGTTVLETDPTVVSKCFVDAFSEHSFNVDDTEIRQVRGKDKMEAIGLILNSRNSPMELQAGIFESFKKNVQRNVSNFKEHPELSAVIRRLREKKISIGIASGLPLILFQMLSEKFNWKEYSLDYVNVYESFAKGRPSPAMIFDMCKKLKIQPGELLKVGDTVADVEEGKNSGSMTAAMVAGTQPEKILRDAAPDFILLTLHDVIGLVEKHNRA